MDNVNAAGQRNGLHLGETSSGELCSINLSRQAKKDQCQSVHTMANKSENTGSDGASKEALESNIGSTKAVYNEGYQNQNVPDALNGLSHSLTSRHAKPSPAKQPSGQALRVALPPVPGGKTLKQNVVLSPGPTALRKGIEPRKGPSPLRWFPRAKKESYLERKIRLLQEKDGVPQGSLDETLDSAPSKLSRIEREKQEAASAAQEATERRHAALVEACWYRILDAAGIPSMFAVESAKEAEKQAAEALSTATKLGVILHDQGSGNSRADYAESDHAVPQVFPGGVGVDDAILATVKNVRDVEREVVMAVKSALMIVTNMGDDGIMHNKETFLSETPIGTTETASKVPSQGHIEPLDTLQRRSVSDVDEEGKYVEDDKSKALCIEAHGKETAVVLPEDSMNEDRSLVSDCDENIGLRCMDDMDSADARQRSDSAATIATASVDDHGTDNGYTTQHPEIDAFESDAASSLDVNHIESSSASASAPLEDAIVSIQNLTRGNAEWQDGPTPEGKAAETSKTESLRTGVEQSEQAEKGPELSGSSKESHSGLKKLKIRPPWQDVDLSEPSAENSPQGGSPRSPRSIFSGANLSAARSLTGSPLMSPRGSPFGSPGGSLHGSPCSSPRLGATVASESGLSLQEKVLVRVEMMEPEQRAALASIVATREMVNELLGELRDVRETGQRRISGGGAGLGDILKKHVSKLEREKAAALAARAREAGAAKAKKVGGRTNQQQPEAEGGLGTVMKKHVSRLERDLKAQKDATQQAEETLPRGQRKGSDPAAFGSLGDNFVKHKSRLEREREAAIAARTAGTGVDRGNDSNQGRESEGVEGKKEGELVDRMRDGQTQIESFGDLTFKKPMSRLERARLAAADAAKQNGGDLAPRIRKGRKSSENSHGEGVGLGDVLVKHMGRLERAVESAKAQSLEERSGAGKAQAKAGPAPSGLGDDLVKHKSKLQLEQERAQAESNGRGSKYPSTKVKRGQAAMVSVPGEGLGEVLVKHKSRLEKDKEAPGQLDRVESGTAELFPTGEQKNEAASGEANSGSRQARINTEQSGSLGDTFVKKVSRLEREKQVAAEEAAAEKGRVQGRRVESNPWEGQGLGQTLKKHVSRLERDKAAWIKAEEEAKRRNGL